MTDFAVFVAFTFILFGFIFLAGFMCGSITKHLDQAITTDKMKKLIAKEPLLTPNMIYKKYKKHFPMLTKRLIRRAFENKLPNMNYAPDMNYSPDIY